MIWLTGNSISKALPLETASAPQTLPILIRVNFRARGWDDDQQLCSRSRCPTTGFQIQWATEEDEKPDEGHRTFESIVCPACTRASLHQPQNRQTLRGEIAFSRGASRLRITGAGYLETRPASVEACDVPVDHAEQRADGLLICGDAL
jgi:hypothetical protein